VSIAAAVAGVACAWLIYVRQAISATALRLSAGAGYRLLAHKYYIDELYQKVIVGTVRTGSKLLWSFDHYVIDGLFVNGTGWVTTRLAWIKYRFVDAFMIDSVGVGGVAWVVERGGSVLRVMQSGVVQHYVLMMTVGVTVVLIIRLVL